MYAIMTSVFSELFLHYILYFNTKTEQTVNKCTDKVNIYFLLLYFGVYRCMTSGYYKKVSV